MPWCQTPSRKKKVVVFTTLTASAYQGQLNAGFSKVCEIFKVRGIESFKYVQEFYTSLLFWLHFHAPKHDTAQTKSDWLLYLSVGLLGGPWPFKVSKVSRPSAFSLKVWLHETKVIVDLKMYSDLSTPPTCQSLHQVGAQQEDARSIFTVNQTLFTCLNISHLLHSD